MDKRSHRPEDLNELERRLTAWRPTSDALDADAVMFAAGRASVRPSKARHVWAALSALLSLLAIVLGLSLMNERNGRIALARRLHDRPTSPVVTPSPAPNAETEESGGPDDLEPDSYLASRRALEKGLDAWPTRVVVRSGTAESSSANPPILTLGQRGTLLDP